MKEDNLKTKISRIIVYLSDEELHTSNQEMDFLLAKNSEFMRGRAYEAKRIRKDIHAILREDKK